MTLKCHPDDQMTPIERKIAISQGQVFDRMPVNLFIPEIKAKMLSCSIADLYLEEDIIVQAEVEAFNRYGMDWFFTGPNSKGIAMSFGAPVAFPADRSPYISDYILDEYDHMDSVLLPTYHSNDRLDFFEMVVKKLSNEGNGIVYIGVSLGGPFSIASYLRGTENLLRDMRKSPDQLTLLIERIIERQKEVVDQFKSIPGITFALADPVASGSLLPAPLFRKFAFPALKEISDYVTLNTDHSPSLHMCGKVERIWSDIKQLDLSTFSIDNACDLKEAIDFFSDKFPITGNVPPVEVMYQGKKEDIFGAVQSCIEKAQGNPQKCVLGLGCDMPYKSPLENIQHFMDAVREHGNYETLKIKYDI